MSQLYEIMTVLSPNESEEDVEAIIGGLRQQISTSGGEVLGVDVWGKRKLAYPINKFEEGTYVLIHAEGPANLSADFRQHTRIRESVLRELIIRLEGAQEAAVRTQLEEQGPEEEGVAEAQMEAAEQRAADKLAEVTAPVTDAVAAAGVEVVDAADLDAPADAVDDDVDAADGEAETATEVEAEAENESADSESTEDADSEDAVAEPAGDEEE